MSLTLSTLLTALVPDFDETSTKLHLAQGNGRERPIDVWYEGHFEYWQASQTQRNFERPRVAAIIQTDIPDIWLFAGLWNRNGDPTWGEERYAPLVGKAPVDCWRYTLDREAAADTLAGRLHVRLSKDFRVAYRLMETIGARLEVSSLIDQPRGTPRFSGYRNIRISMPVLQQIIASSPEDWRTALMSVSGVYLITTPDGSHYVGSASGMNGFWERWSAYARTGHGENAMLRDVDTKGFHFSILETADTRTERSDIIARESHWKQVLGSRATGLNLN